ncbi:XdhC family protein [Paracoccus benzoatiresistens]|uniref:XdhC family protein n=1 Tax=Paracoccus benzoatiresistens TaxID=2997341 RepID=A0ABT4J2R1_9RHOB|nr:XdhC family protein [Paracoccus sp. EF6]MCZ0961401.1 XdhC family protein [Paracoccus sp. EF6]
MMRSDPAPDTRQVELSGDPLTAALECPDSVLAIITGITGPSYRPLGEIMAFCGDRHVGSLSSGCIETDLARHAQQSLQDGPRVVRYGEGSPWFDLQLPCGGGLEITLIPRPCPQLLAEIAEARARRQPVGLVVTHDLALRRGDPGATGPTADGFRILLVPPPRFLIFGQGPEAAVFAGLVHAAGYPHLLLTPDPATIAQAEVTGAMTRLLHWPALPTDLAIDDRSAVILFFHDHDWEPPILARALESPAFYIGAQGSLRARDKRLASLRERGVSDGLDRLKGPIGLIPSARNPRVLAVSVLAEVLLAAA